MTANNLVPVIDAKVSAAARIAGDVHEILQHVLIEDGWATASDGFRVLRVELPKPQPAPSVAVPGASPVVPEGRVLVQARALRWIGKRLGWARFAWFTRTPSGNLAVAMDDWKRGLTTKEASRLSQPFPDVTKPQPKGEPKATVVLNADLLTDLVKAIDQAGAGEVNGGITFHIYGPTDPVVLAARDGSGRRIRALLMPMDAEGLAPEPYPDQEREGRPVESEEA